MHDVLPLKRGCYPDSMPDFFLISSLCFICPLGSIPISGYHLISYECLIVTAFSAFPHLPSYSVKLFDSELVVSAKFPNHRSSCVVPSFPMMCFSFLQVAFMRDLTPSIPISRILLVGANGSGKRCVSDRLGLRVISLMEGK